MAKTDELFKCPKCAGSLSPRYGDNTVYLKCDTCSYARCIDPDGDCGARPVTGGGADIGATIILLLVSLMIAAGCWVLFALAMGW